MPFRGEGVHPIGFGQQRTFRTIKNGDPTHAMTFLRFLHSNLEPYMWS
jgi:hypothetical protein